MILLRKQIQEVLFEEGFNELYLSKNGNNMLYLAGPCGKPVIVIPDITVPANINVKEREYLTELVTDFIKKRGDDIDKIWSYMKTEIVLPTYSMEEHGFVVYIYNYSKSKGFRLQTENYDLLYETESEEYTWKFKEFLKEELIVETLKKKAEPMKLLFSYAEMYMRKDEIDNEIQKLKSCRM